MDKKAMLYGANGYTGYLILKEMLELGISTIAAGRNKEAIEEISDKYHVESRVFELTSSESIVSQLKGVSVVLHAAGPFVHTAKPMMDACIASGIHYLDITGEIPVFSLAQKKSEAAKTAGIMMMPGVGFDVVPTDCMARYLSELMPNATKLQLAFSNYGGRVSQGTARSALEGISYPGSERKDGKIIPVPKANKSMTVPFLEGKPRFAMQIPWGDVFTAYHSTGIPNIETYMAIRKETFDRMRFITKYFSFLFKMPFIKTYLANKIKKMPIGPNEEERKNGFTMVYGKVSNELGNHIEARLKVAEGYKFTALSAALICKKVLEGDLKSGFQTPSSCYGKELYKLVPGSSEVQIISQR
jgi:short subunit dehydrogenase-like uncharacterized protein